ncbi:MAG: hypothetical protein FKY71_12300 [Spiribacter salinus]|uniref:Uncharacterized protein n=1 Tax=Spiribacter salinus TaxID=1335746 RepID=A0A540VPQ2_9GAMM|nr:MAG: hypothetical protein FKY71_12300 [Spiribacter salinus]
MTQDPGPETAEQIIKNLHNFNRKERDHLMKFALSDSPSQPQLSKGLWRAIRPENSRRQRPNPDGIFVGMDYHLNWLYAALMLPGTYEQDGMRHQPNQWPEYARTQKHAKRLPIEGNQEDVDLLVAFTGDKDMLHLALIEAKLTSGWNSKQFRSKVGRLNLIRKAARGQKYAGPDIHWQFILASPKPPENGAFSETSLAEMPRWIKAESKEGSSLRHFAFGPERFYQVKRESSKGHYWQVQLI